MSPSHAKILLTLSGVATLAALSPWTLTTSTTAGHGHDRDEVANALQPAPTEHDLDDDAESKNKELRERWIEEMHRTAPGVDWRAIERENGRREMERRQEEGLADGGPPRWGPLRREFQVATFEVQLHDRSII